MKKLLKRILLVLLVVLVGLYCGRNFIVRKAVEVGTRRLTGFPLTIGHVRLGLFTGTLEMRDLKLTNPPEFRESRFVDVPLLTVNYETLSLFRTAPHIREVFVNIHEIVQVKNPTGTSNALKLQERIAAAGPGARRYRVDLLKVRIGTVIIKDFAKASPTEKKTPLNQTVVFQNVTESANLPALVLRTVFGQVGENTSP